MRGNAELILGHYKMRRIEDSTCLQMPEIRIDG